MDVTRPLDLRVELDGKPMRLQLDDRLIVGDCRLASGTRLRVEVVGVTVAEAIELEGKRVALIPIDDVVELEVIA